MTLAGSAAAGDAARSTARRPPVRASLIAQSLSLTAQLRTSVAVPVVGPPGARGSSGCGRSSSARRGTMDTVRRGLLLVVSSSCSSCWSPRARRSRPSAKHVMIVVMDQMQPGYAKQYDMKNVLWLQQHGVNFPNAYVGDMASETVVSHNVMVSGLFPKHMGWSDEAFRDVDNVLGLGAERHRHHRRPGLRPVRQADRRHGTTPSSATTCTRSSPARSSPTSARRATRSSPWPPPAPTTACAWAARRAADLPDPSVVPWTGTYRGASGGNVPDYITNDNRYLRQRRQPPTPTTYGTKTAVPAWMYPEDGRYVARPVRRPRERRPLGRRRRPRRSWTTRTGPASG